MDKPKFVTFLPPPVDFQITHMFSNRIAPSQVELVHVPIKASEDEACQAVANAKVILSPPVRRFNRRILGAAKGVKLIQTISVGYDFIDMEAAKELNIPVARAHYESCIS